MLQKTIEVSKRVGLRQRLRSWSLQLVLWAGWTLTVIAAAAQFVWAHQGMPIPLIGLVIRCILVGVIGLIILTWLEIQFEPWRFTGDQV